MNHYYIFSSTFFAPLLLLFSSFVSVAICPPKYAPLMCFPHLPLPSFPAFCLCTLPSLPSQVHWWSFLLTVLLTTLWCANSLRAHGTGYCLTTQWGRQVGDVCRWETKVFHGHKGDNGRMRAGVHVAWLLLEGSQIFSKVLQHSALEGWASSSLSATRVFFLKLYFIFIRSKMKTIY